MLYSEIIAVCSQIHTKRINTLCGQNIFFLNVEPVGAVVVMLYVVNSALLSQDNIPTNFISHLHTYSFRPLPPSPHTMVYMLISPHNMHGF